MCIETYFGNRIKMRGVFYNSKKSACSIWETGKMCYDALSASTKFTLDYSEETVLDMNYDFAIFNEHFAVNNWMTKEIIECYKKPTFCIVTEVSFSEDPIKSSPKIFDHYIVLDPTVQETQHIHAFGRPLEDYEIDENSIIDDRVPNIFSFGFATNGKEWHKIVEIVQNEFDYANIHFNIPFATHIPENDQTNAFLQINDSCNQIITKKGIQLKITHTNLSKDELIELCAKQTINCFYYNREHLFSCGLSAVTDQAISSGRPMLITRDRTFRHIHKYIDYYPNISLKEAIQKTREGVLQMKKDWSKTNFLLKFETLLVSQK